MTEITWHGPEQLRELLVPVNQLVRHPANPRRGRVELIRESLERWGQVRPVLTDGGQVVAGNHTYMAVIELGWTHIAAVPNQFKSPEEARAYLVADNRLPELGTYDEAQKLELLEGIETVGGWAGTGYTADDLEDLRAMQGAVSVTETEEFAGDFAATPEELAARAEALQGGRSLSEVVLLLTQAQQTDFEMHMKILQKEYGGVGVTETVLRAITDAAAR